MNAQRPDLLASVPVSQVGAIADASVVERVRALLGLYQAAVPIVS